MFLKIFGVLQNKFFKKSFLPHVPKNPFLKYRNIGTAQLVTKTALKPAYLRGTLGSHFSTFLEHHPDPQEHDPKISPMPKKSLTPIAAQPLTYRGTTQPLKHWAHDLNIPYHTLAMRYKRGDRGDHLLRPVQTPIEDDPPVSPHTIQFMFNGKVRSLAQWAAIFGIGFDTAYKRYQSGVRDFYDIFGIRAHT